MFGGLANLIQSPPTIDSPPKNVPPPTPVALPQCHPQLSVGADGSSSLPAPKPSLVRFLQTLHRPQDVSDAHFAALGAHVHVDVPLGTLLPDPSYVPSPEWDTMTSDRARDINGSYQRPLSSNRSAPGPQVYLERQAELSVANQAAFRTVRRIRPEPGQAVTRLGNSYEFFKQLELMAGYWDDTSLPPQPLGTDDTSVHTNAQDEGREGKGEETAMHPSLENTHLSAETSAGKSDACSKPPALSSPPSTPSSSSSLPTQERPQEGMTTGRVTYRVFPGATMPPEVRHNLVSAFVKVIAYDFGCTLVSPRVEPRMHILEPPDFPRSQRKEAVSSSSPVTTHQQKASYIPSGCIFIARIPDTREAARQGIIEGPVVAVSARNSTGFAKPSDARIDFGREIVAALATAQLRARSGAGGNSDGRPEMRFGQGKWWATARRWGGGEGGPIGREVETQSSKENSASMTRVPAMKDAAGSSTPPSSHETSPISPSIEGDAVKSTAGIGSAPISPPPRTTSASRFPPPTLPLPLPMRGPPLAKRARKAPSMGPSIYDRYRAIRPPQSNWDKKSRYEAIGRPSGIPPVAEVTIDRLPVAPDTHHASHASNLNNESGGAGGDGETQQCHYLYYDDDVFVISSLFHHMCIVRFRVPGRLLAVLDGAPEEPDDAGSTEYEHNGKGKKRTWDRLEVWRTRWFDMFLVEDRLEAMKAVWGTMGYLMRAEEKSDQKAKVDTSGGSGGEDVTMKDV